jgi:sporulation protein YlmC with PRC-barrel domain
MIRASDLIGCVVHSESGEKLGRVHDLRAQSDGDGWLLIGLVIGGGGVLARLGATGTVDGATHAGQVIPWQEIKDLQPGRIIVLDQSEALQDSRRA